jgi:chaperonin GroEL (HSP60 family)
MNKIEFMKYILYENNKNSLENIYILLKEKKISSQYLDIPKLVISSDDELITLYEKGEIDSFRDIIERGKFHIYNRCRYTGKEIDLKDFDITQSYWTPFVVYVCDKRVKQEGKSNETYECQKIDCNCNDCKFFQRIKQSNGYCDKKKVKVFGHPNTTNPHNIECFVHRKD